MDNSSSEFTRALFAWEDVYQRRSMQHAICFFKRAGLSIAQLGAMMHLYHSGASAVTDMASHLGISNPAASQMIDRMVQQGLLSRAEDPSDRRSKQINLTAAGKALIEESFDARRKWMEDLAHSFPAEQQTTITGALKLLAQAAEGQD